MRWPWIATLLGVLGGLGVAGHEWWRGALDAPLPEVAIQSDPFASQRPLTLTVLGTSLTAGSTWPEQLAQDLALCTSRPVRLERIATGGQTSAWGLRQIERVVATSPDILLIGFTINDADLRRQISPSESRRLHREMLVQLSAALPQTDLHLMRLNRAYGLRAALRVRLVTYEAALPDLAQETGVGFFDLRPMWTAYLSEAGPGASMPDGLHPTDAVARAVNVAALRDRLCP